MLLVVGIVGVCVVPLLLLMGFFTIQPNQARVLILFGDYKGTVRDEGFHWANPFLSRSAGTTVDAESGKNVPISTKVSLRARTYNGEHLKVCLLYTSHFGFVELRLHGGQRSQGRVGLCLLFDSGDAERGGRAKEKGGGKQGAAAHECSSAECDGMLVQYGSSSIEHVARSKQAD